MKRTNLLVSSIVASLMFAPAAVAGDWTLRVFGVAGDTSGTETRATRGEVGLRVEGGSAGGVGVGLELQWRPRIGFDLELMTGTAGYRVRIFSTPGSLALRSDPIFQVLSMGLDFDLAPGGRVRLYAGPRVGLLRREGFYFVIERDGRAREADKSTSDLVVGLVLGAEIELGSRGWALHSSLRYLEAGEDQSFVRLEPLMATLGVAKRF